MLIRFLQCIRVVLHLLDTFCNHVTWFIYFFVCILALLHKSGTVAWTCRRT
jgi:hypothetical protein